MSNQPLFKHRSGSVSGTVWGNERESKTGNKFLAYDIVVERNYKVEDEWKTTSKFQQNDCFDVVICTQKCYEFVQSHKQEK